MSGETLLYWLSHRGQGAWSSFRQAVAGLRDSGEEVEDALRYSLSDLRHVEFFVDGSRQWRAFAPQLAGLCGIPQTALLCGARSPKLLTELERAAIKHGCGFEMDCSVPHLPARVTVAGSDEQLVATARACGLRYQPDQSLWLCRGLEPVTKLKGTPEDEPHRWQARAFDLQRRHWVDGYLPGTAREYRTRYGTARHFLCDRQDRLWPMDKRRAVYAAAAQQRVKLATYDFEQCALSVPRSAPLPQAFARAACLCSGWLPQIQNDLLVYVGVTPEVAAWLLVLAGQPHPGFVPADGIRQRMEIR